MTKFSVTRNGFSIDKSLYTWDENTKTFSSEEDDLVLDFNGINGVTFRTGSRCTFKTHSDCTFDTGSWCMFYTGSGCTFKTDNGCIFNACYNCTFITGSYCTFKAGYNCTFTTGKNCFVTRFDVEGVTEIPLDKTIKLKGYGIVGYTIVEEKKESPSCADKIIEIDGKKYKLVDA